MPPTSSTLDPFSAIAEPRRREMLKKMADLGGGELAVNDIVAALGWPQPQVSKHLAVLRDVGILAVRRRGRERLYSINGDQLKTIHDWAAMFDRFWTHHLDAVKARAEAMARAAELAAAPHPLLSQPNTPPQEPHP